MFGDLIGEERRRHRSSFPVKERLSASRIESQFQATGKVLGVDVIDYATYGSVYGRTGTSRRTDRRMIFTSRRPRPPPTTGTGVGHMLGRGGAACGAAPSSSSAPRRTSRS